MVKTASSSLMAKLAIAMAALAVIFCMAAMPGQAFAANSTSEPDNIIVVNGTEVDLDAVYAMYHSSGSQTPLGGLFVQNGAVKVVKTDKYVTVSEIVNYANLIGASITWTSGKTMTFTAWNTVKTDGVVTGWSAPTVYTKNTTFTYDNMMSTCTTFYNASATAPDTTDPLATSEAVISLKSTTVTIPSGSSASAVLASSAYPTVGYTAGALDYDTPRLVWGYNPNVTSQAGNRFPSNIETITIS